MIKFENVDLKHLPIISEYLNMRVADLGPGGMYSYLHNPLYSHFSKGHAKIALVEYKNERFLVLGKYVNMFGKIYNRLVGVPYCGNRQLEKDFLEELIQYGPEYGIEDYQFTDTELDIYDLKSRFEKLSLNNLDYYDIVDERIKHISKSKWRMRRKIGMFHGEGFFLACKFDLPKIIDCFDSWATWKENKESFSRGQFNRFFKHLKENPDMFKNEYAIFVYYYGERIIWVEVMTRNTPTHWRGEMLFTAKDNLPEDVVRHVSAYGHYRRTLAMRNMGAKYYYVAGAWGGTLSKKDGTLNHKQNIEKYCVNYYKATKPLMCRLKARTPISQIGNVGSNPTTSTTFQKLPL